MVSGVITIYRMGHLRCSICAPIEMEHSEILRQIEVLAPCGTRSGWSMATNEEFRTGEKLPYPCEITPNREHWYVVA